MPYRDCAGGNVAMEVFRAARIEHDGQWYSVRVDYWDGYFEQKNVKIFYGPTEESAQRYIDEMRKNFDPAWKGVQS